MKPNHDHNIIFPEDILPIEAPHNNTLYEDEYGPSEQAFVGDILTEQKPQTTTRCYFQNLNGIGWNSEGGEWPAICQAMAAIHVDIFCCAEINRDVKQPKVSEKISSINKRHFQHHRYVASTSTWKPKSTYKPGGTAIMVVQATTTLVQSTTRDRMGRWAATTLSGINNTGVTIISAYQVCQTKITGKNTAANQQISQLIEEASRQSEIARLNPREAFIRDLHQFIRQQQQNGNQILLLGDFNEEMGSGNSGIANLSIECGLIDIFGIRLGTATNPSTWQRGNKRLDYALASPGILPLIKAAGYEPYSYRITSDHRGFFIDLDTKALFGNKPSKIAPITHRDFESHTPGTIPRYITSIIKELEAHNFKARLQELSELTVPNHALAEKLDRDLERAALHAAKKCRRKYNTPWSPTFTKAWAELRYWKLHKVQLRHPQHNMQITINKWKQRHPELPIAETYTADQINHGYTQALAKLRDARLQATQLRSDYLDAQAKRYADTDQNGKEHIIHKIKQAEAIKRTYRHIRNLTKPQQKGGITHLKIPIDPNADPKECNPGEENWQTERIPQEIERLLIKRNQQHFGQANDTPFITTGIQDQVQYNGTGNVAELILNGEYDNPTLAEATKLFINHLKRKTQTKLKGAITCEEFKSKLKTWPEKTATSPSGLHLGHYQVLRRHHGLAQDDPQRKNIERGQDLLTEARVELINYALKFGYNYHRWTKVVNVMIQKDPGNPKIHRLRVIHLYEADYNLMLAVKWRTAMHHAEDSGILNDGLYGSRAGRSAHDPVFIEILQNEIYRCSMKSGINFDLDATACYDRILASIATIASRRMGMSKHVVVVNASTLRDAKFQLKTNLGVSEEWYQHSTDFPIHGTGQGSGNSPQIWCFLCSVLFDAFQEATPGAKFASFNGKTEITIHMIGFVDDCTQRVNEFQAEVQPSAGTLLNKMQSDAQKWNDLLWTSGGALEIPKCSFHLIESDWTPNGKPFLKGGTQAQAIHITNNNRALQVLQRSNYHSHRTLGCYVNPANNMTQQKEVLQRKSDAAATILATNVLTRLDTRTYYRSMYLPSITYPFPVTNLTEKECTKIQNKFMQTVVRHCGYNKHMKLEIRHAPQAYGGAGFSPLYVEQGTAQIKMALKHLRTPHGQPGKMLQIALSWAQAYAGISTFLWTSPNRPTPEFPSPWIASVRHFLNKINGSIQIDPNNDIVPKKLRERDEFIMDLAIQQQYSPETIERINACRRYLQAITLADITNSTGARLLPGVTDGSVDTSKESIQIERFNQKKPATPAWKSWRRFLGTISNPQGRLNQPLRRWTVHHDDCRRRPKYVHDPVKEVLYKHQSGNKYLKIPSTHGQSAYTIPVHPTTVTKVIGYPVHALDLGDKIRPLYNYAQQQHPHRSQMPTFQEFVKNLPPWEKELLTTVELEDDPARIIKIMNEADFYVGTDGSVRNQAGSYGYVGKSHDHVSLFRGRGPAPGANPTSFRAEAYGALAMYRFLIRLSEYTDTQIKSTCTHYIDNKSVAKRLQKEQKRQYHNPTKTLTPDWDVISTAAQSISAIPTKIVIKWIKSHQDTKQLRHKLSRPAQINCEADDQAERYQQEAGHPRPQPPILPTNTAQLLLNDKCINSHYTARIHEEATIPPLFKYYQERFRWSTTTRENIDWDTYKQIIRPFRSKQTTLVKHLHKIAPTGEIAHRNDPYQKSKCPCCPQDPETNDHILQCRATSRQNWRSKAIRSTQNYLQCIISSDPTLCDILRDGLQRWHNNFPLIEKANYPEAYHPLIQTQNDIGWGNLYRARWSIHWCKQHNKFATNAGLEQHKADGKTWVRKVGRRLLTQWFELWQLRNTECHGRDLEEQAQQRQQKIHEETEELYSYRHQTMQSDRGMYCNTIADHIKEHTTQTQQEEWVTLWGKTIRTSMRQAKTMA